MRGRKLRKNENYYASSYAAREKKIEGLIDARRPPEDGGVLFVLFVRFFFSRFLDTVNRPELCAIRRRATPLVRERVCGRGLIPCQRILGKTTMRLTRGQLQRQSDGAMKYGRDQGRPYPIR